MTQTGRIVEVSIDPIGGNLATDHAAGAATLTLDLDTGGVSEFNDAGGQVAITVDDGTVYVLNYASTDPDAGTIALVSTTPVAFAADTFVAAYPTGDEKVATVILDGEDDSMPCRVPHTLYDRLAEGVRDPGTEEGVEVAEDAGGEWSVVDLLGVVPLVDGSYIDPATAPASPPTPPAAPVAPTVSTTGMPRGFLMRVTNAAPGWSYVWHVVDTTSGGEVGDYPATKNPVFYTENLPSGNPFVTTSNGYTFHVTATNESGSAVSADFGPLSLVLNNSSTIADLAVDKLVAGDLTGAFALLGSLQVGASITITDAGGIVIAQPSGGKIVFPADGTAASISSHLDAFSLSVRDRLAIKGLLNEISTGAVVALASGISAPNSPPSVTDYWPSVSFRAAPGFDSYNRGLVPHSTDSNAWYTVNYAFNGSIRLCDNTGAGVASWDLRSTAGLTATGLTMIGTVIYVLCFDSTRNYRWFVRRYDSAASMAFLGEWEWTNMSGTPYDACIGRTEDGSAVLIACCESATDRPRVYRYTPVTGALITVTNENGVAGSNYIRLAEVVAASLTSIWYGSADLAVGPAYVYTKASSGVHVAGADGARISSDEWAAAAGSTIKGLAWSPLASRWYHLNDTGTRYQYGTVKANTARSITYSWFDSDSAGTGQHETNQGPANAYTQKARALFQVVTGPPNDTGGTDDPDSVRVWIGGNRQTPDLAPGVTSATYDAPSTGTTTKAAAFPAAATPAELRSGGQIGSDFGIRLKGDGTGRLGDATWGTSGQWDFARPPTLVGDAWHLVGNSGQPAFANGWVNQNATADPVRYRKTVAGMLVLAGRPNGASSTSDVVFILPSGFYPTDYDLLGMMGWDNSLKGAAEVRIGGTGASGGVAVGEVKIIRGTTKTWYSFNGISAAIL